MRVAIIGDGLLANHVFEALRDRGIGPEVWGHDFVDVTNPGELDVLRGSDVIINTAAFHRLAECEKRPDIAQAVNADGPRNVGKLGVPQVFASTDYVFNDDGPHGEVLPGEQPRSVYGRTKLAGELNTLERGGIVVRVAGLFGHHRSHKGPQFPDVVLADDAPLKVPMDQRFTPTYAVDAAQRIADLAIDLATRGPVSGIYHATNLGGTNWAEFASEVAEIANGKRHIIPFRAKDPIRPTDSRLVSTRLPELRHFRFALIDWAKRRAAERISPLRAER